jgi:uncharacterized protein (DUF2225 family)
LGQGTAGFVAARSRRISQKKPEILKSWEEGREYPTVNQAKEAAKKYKIPYMFFSCLNRRRISSCLKIRTIVYFPISF